MALVLTGCPTPNDGDNSPQPLQTTLTIQNESFSDLIDVKWSGTLFADHDNSLGISSSVKKTVAEGSGYIFFSRKSNPIIARTQELIVIEKDKDQTFRFSDNILIVEASNPDNAGTLKDLISRLLAPKKPTLTAKYGSIEASWDAIDGATSYRVYYGTTATPPEEPVRTVTENTALITGLENESSYYVWVRAVNSEKVSILSPPAYINLSPMYTISYTLNGGTGNTNPPSYTVKDATITLSDPVRSGYTFDGWYDNAEMSGSAIRTIPSGSSENKHLYAKWSIATYTITYILNGGTISVTNPSTYTIESSTIILNNPIREHYTFEGWYDNEGLSGSATSSIPVGSTGNLSLYAKWNPIGYTITYILNGGTNNANNPASYTVETSLTLTEPTRTGYAFDGWYDNVTFTGSMVRTIPAGSSENKILYAKWNVIMYTITYFLYGGTNHADNPSIYTIETPTIILNNPVRENYTFGGWYTNEGLTGSTISNISAGSTGNIIMYAKWKSTLPPESPSILAISDILGGEVELLLSRVESADGYYVYASTSPDGIYTQVPSRETYTVLSGITKLSISELSRDISYFKVSAYNNYGESAKSAYVSR